MSDPEAEPVPKDCPKEEEENVNVDAVAAPETDDLADAEKEIARAKADLAVIDKKLAAEPITDERSGDRYLVLQQIRDRVAEHLLTWEVTRSVIRKDRVRKEIEAELAEVGVTDLRDPRDFS